MIVVDIDGNISERKYGGDLNEIYDAIGALVFDIVRIGGNLLMLVDDEGLLKGEVLQRVNWKATYLNLVGWMENPQNIDWKHAMKMSPPMIAGSVAILGDNGEDCVDLDDASRELVLERLGESVE